MCSSDEHSTPLKALGIRTVRVCALRQITGLCTGLLTVWREARDHAAAAAQHGHARAVPQVAPANLRELRGVCQRPRGACDLLGSRIRGGGGSFMRAHAVPDLMTPCESPQCARALPRSCPARLANLTKRSNEMQNTV